MARVDWGKTNNKPFRLHRFPGRMTKRREKGIVAAKSMARALVCFMRYCLPGDEITITLKRNEKSPYAPRPPIRDR